MYTPLGNFEASNSTSKIPSGFISLTKVATSLPRLSKTLSETNPLSFNTYLIVVTGLNGFG